MRFSLGFILFFFSVSHSSTTSQRLCAQKHGKNRSHTLMNTFLNVLSLFSYSISDVTAKWKCATATISPNTINEYDINSQHWHKKSTRNSNWAHSGWRQTEWELRKLCVRLRNVNIMAVISILLFFCSLHRFGSLRFASFRSLFVSLDTNSQQSVKRLWRW